MVSSTETSFLGTYVPEDKNWVRYIFTSFVQLQLVSTTCLEMTVSC